MKLTQNITTMILNAESKALATNNSDTLNVVPVSTVKVIDDQIILVNYFLGKTLKNIQQNPHVSLACWSGFEGYQIKGHVEHVVSGELFDTMVSWVKEILPHRVVKGILILTPEEIFDISADRDRAGMKLP